MTQSANTTVAFANTEGNTDVVYLIRVKDDNTTSRTITWPSGMVWNGGSEPTLLQSAGGASLKAQTFKLTTRDNGATWYGDEVVNYDVFKSYQLWGWGSGTSGQLAQNNRTDYSSPVQVPGTIWSKVFKSCGDDSIHAIQKNDKTVWVMGNNDDYRLGLGDQTKYSSPVQLSGDWYRVGGNGWTSAGVKTDGTLWTWGYLGGTVHNNNTTLSSPKQVGSGTDWSTADIDGLNAPYMCTKTDGTLWVWGGNGYGTLGQNDRTNRSSPIQIPGTTWRQTSGTGNANAAIKTDGTLWMWGRNHWGQLAQNNTTYYSSPVQIPGTSWKLIRTDGQSGWGVKTDGTLWTWGIGNSGWLAQNNRTSYSSPVQIPGTTWVDLDMGDGGTVATKTDGTLWAWGKNNNGVLGQNSTSTAYYSSPVQIPGTTWSTDLYAISRDSSSIKALRSS